MKKTSIYLFALIGLMALSSCFPNREEIMEDDTYYFTSEDHENIINYDYEEGQVIIYENQSGERYHWRVMENITEIDKEVHGSFWDNYTSVLYHYEKKLIRLEVMENGDKDKYEIVNYSFRKRYNKFHAGAFIPVWNIQTFGYYEKGYPVNLSVGQYIDEPKTAMEVNGHLFTRVIEIESETSEIPQSFGQLPDNVHRVFYDYDFGIIQFDDLDGNEWKVIYPD